MKSPALILLMLALTACSESGLKFKTSTGEVWNTRYRVTYQSEKELDDSIQCVFDLIDRSVSVFNDSSVVSRVNRNEPVELDSVFQHIFYVSKYVNRLTRGAFDPTIGPLIEVYGFGRNRDFNEPADIEIDSIMQFVGIADCEIIEGNMHKKSPFTTFNFSGIAKGYGVDMIAEMLRRNGVVNFLVEIGGDIAACGYNREGKPWAIMLESVDRVIYLTEGAVATSGNYRNYHADCGHIIDPRTGKPTKTSVPAVSVIAPTCILSDAIATACMVTDIDTIHNVRIIKAKNI